MKKARISSLGSNDYPDGYDCKFDWPENCSCQGGGTGIVFSEDGNYQTAFFEAFPKEPSCFLRGEGKTIEEAEKDCWEKYKSVTSCSHEMERRNRTDGYGYCKHCSYSSMVFEPLTKCCKCNIPTAYASDFRGKHYCKKHARTRPMNPDPNSFDRKWSFRGNRLPRKRKKELKNAGKVSFRIKGIKGKVIFTYKVGKTLTCGEYRINLLFRKQEKELLKTTKSFTKLEKKMSK